MADKKHKNQVMWDRRHIMKMMGAFGVANIAIDPVQAVIAGLIEGKAMAAEASEAGAKEARNYMHLYLCDGPARWYFDLWLNPYAPQSTAGLIKPHPALSTGFSETAAGSGQFVPTYQTIPITVAGEKLYLPPIWGGTLPRPGGATVPMSALLENMLTVRGIDMKSDGHQNNRKKNILPLSGTGSLDGLLADQSLRPFPAVAVDTGVFADTYQSLAGIGQLRMNLDDKVNNPLQQLLTAFQFPKAVTENPVYQKQKIMQETIDKAVAAMETEMAQRAPESKGILRDRSSARQMFKNAVMDLPTMWNQLFSKYQNLITRSGAFDIPNVNNVPVINGIFPPEQKRMMPMFGNPVILENPDLRTLFRPDTTIKALAESFAVAEFLFTQGYGAGVVGIAYYIQNLNMMASGASSTVYYIMDEHFSGTPVSVLLTSFYFRSVASCLYELIQVLKTKGIWDETVIQLSSEFSRAPRADRSGSDHGFEAAVMTMFSGAIKKPIAIGNIRVDNADHIIATDNAAVIASYAGTWGGGAPVDHDKTVDKLNVGHVTSTVATLMRVARPQKNFAPLIEEAADGVKSVVGAPRNV